uniref:Uncharacterized protein n=1 Tax=Panagrolaimus sp. JU765 TaxID=591449 RepID=A0AC34PUP7_9BILA
MGHNNMGLLGAISYIIGNVVGAGIFITPGDILNKVDSIGLSIIIWIVAAGIAILGAFCYVELGTSIRRSGADFAYVCYAKWYPVAFSFMCVGCVLTYPATLAVQAETFAEYFFSLIWLLLFLNFFSVKTLVSRFQVVASIAKFVATGLIIVTGFYFLIFKHRSENFEDIFANSTNKPQNLIDGLFSGLFSYDGWDIINFGLEEVENPRRTMPLAIVFAMTSIALFYLAINIAYFAILDVSTIQNSESVAIDFAKKTLGGFQYSVPFFVSIVLIGSLNSTMFSASRYLYAASREGHLPAFISCVNKFHDSPRVALFVHVLLAIMFSFLGGLSDLVQYISFAQWSQRMVTMVALLYMRFTHKPVHPDAIRTPIFLPIFFFICCTTLTVVTIIETPKTALVTGSLLIAGLIIFTIFKWEKTLNSIPSYKKFSNKLNVKIAFVFQIVFDGLIDQGSVEDDPMAKVLEDAKREKEKRKLGFVNQALDAVSIAESSSKISTISYRPQRTKL